MESRSVESNGMSLEYFSFGNGPQVLLCFHGFGRRAEDFFYFREELEKNFTVYSFNVFHHGKSEYPGDRIERNTLRPDELKALISLFLDQHSIERFSLMGYSMGGKITLMLLHLFAERINHMYLLAPDGIVYNQWYRFTSKNRIGNSIYKSILRKPGFFFFILRLLRKTRLISDKFMRFVMANLDTRNKRELVYKVWMTLRNIDPSPSESSKIIRKLNLPVYLFYGKHDRIIKSSSGKSFASKAGDSVRFIEVECGHNLFTPDTKSCLKKVFSIE
ncbi:MAG TPA: hypothetical protein DCD96_00965 [Flavobacteriales bacterium]|nr:hypothetical protein [Flavobacteriales bacterium]HRE73133.1 alpha/beta hydrolase [Flavobacteriales bacterium]HRJ35625.1 alpha/beta hydrolase [Flavobacteriales bacterium]